MVLVRGLDRTGALSGIPDEVWHAHTTEVQSRFEAQVNAPEGLGFDDFCAQFAQPGGSLSTAAVERYCTAAVDRPAVRGIGPAWTRGLIEKPQGEKSMGSYTVLEYTQEQQERLGVDANGDSVPRDRAHFFESHFPAHWGEPPRRQTRDLVPLPGGYGEGSSTLASWIGEKMQHDELGAGSSVSSKDEWPELVGIEGEASAATIKAERPDLKVQVLPHGAMATMDYDTSRVRINLSDDGTVASPPKLG